MYIRKLKNAIKKIDTMINRIERTIAGYPEGELFCYKNRKYVKWYYKKGKNVKWIPKKEKQFAETMANKKYLEAWKQDLLDEKECIRNLISTDFFADSEKGIHTRELFENQLYTPLLLNSNLLMKKRQIEWMNSPYKKYDGFPLNLKHKTCSGVYVRSKSEADIWQVLIQYSIAFHYEEEIILNEQPFYPDFTILDPRTGELVIWEHFGRMGDPNYRKKNLWKIEMYCANGFLPGKNFIMTFENQEIPFVLSDAEEIVWKYFIL